MENNFCIHCMKRKCESDLKHVTAPISAETLYAMSGHNPNISKFGQPNASWNHLQVPSFIPRQPQLAHVHMNDSILRSSPLNWHSQPDTALYNYAMAAAAATQHKTPLELNPLLPAFVRPPVANSFGSVDLSFPSHHRHNSTPSPHNINNVSVPSSATPPLDFPSSLQIPSKSTMNSSGAILSPNSLKYVASNIVNGDKIPNNGSEKSVNCDSVAPSNLATGLFVAHQLNNDSTKNSPWIPPTTNAEPIELIAVKIFKNALMKNELYERNSTIDPASVSNIPPATSSFPGLSTSTMNNNTSAQRLTEYPSPTHGNTSNSLNTSKDSQATTSNDESLDSNVGKKRRRRKPNKTCRLSNNDIDEDVISNNNKHLETVSSDPFSIDARLMDVGTNNINRSFEPEKEIHSKLGGNESVDFTSSVSVNQSLVPSENISNVENGLERSEDASISDTRVEKLSSPVTRNRSRLTSPNELSQENTSNSSNSTNQRRPGKRKLEVDDCETIDKIAAMIASSEFNPKNGRSTPVQTEENLPALENGNLNDILDTKDEHVDQKDNRFEDVEIKLEEMFAGIDDDIDQTKVKDTKVEGCKEVRVAIESLGSLGTLVPKSGNKKKTKAKAHKKMLNSSSSSEETDNKAKKKLKRLPKSKTKKGVGKKTNKPVKGNANVTDNKKTKIKEEPLETASKFKGPFIHVKNDGSSNVVNAPITEEVAENKSKVKKTLINQSQNDRSKIRGLHVSTLSMKYDAATTDKTWICVFCKMGPHKFGLGDLFGPYILSTTCEDFALSQIDPSEDVFKSKKTKASMIQKRTLPVSDVGVTAAGNKRKRKTNEPIPSTSSSSNLSNNSLSSCNSDVVDIFYGMTKATDTSYEVWVHGDCAVWSDGVHLIGTRIVGLEAAVWGSSRHKCNNCQNYGAMLCCHKRGCGEVAHIPCARKANWKLCDDDFKILCDKHCDKAEKTETVKQT